MSAVCRKHRMSNELQETRENHMKCIDFDKQFERYTREWMAKNAEKYNNDMDAIEALMPDI